MYTVLIVEDCPMQRSLMRDVLAYFGISSVEVANGLQALRLLETQLPDLIISDLDMPYMVGTELCAVVKSQPQTQHIPVLLCSANYDFIDPHQIIRKKADGFLKKPYGMDELEVMLRHVLPNFQSQVAA
jgi:twitching motility two-component system response regulator PilH